MIVFRTSASDDAARSYPTCDRAAGEKQYRYQEEES